MNQAGALALTLACEVPLALGLTRLPALAGGKAGARPALARVLLVAAGASLLTHPVAWRAALLPSPAQYQGAVGWLELGVVLAEAAWYRCCLPANWRQAAVLSLAANAFSATVGWLAPW